MSSFVEKKFCEWTIFEMIIRERKVTLVAVEHGRKDCFCYSINIVEDIKNCFTSINKIADRKIGKLHKLNFFEEFGDRWTKLLQKKC